MSETIDPTEQTTQQTPESGTRFDRLWYTRESEAGRIPTDPEWDVYSDLILNFESSIDPGVERVDGLGDVDPEHFGRTSEEIEITLAYALQRPVVDSNGDPLDPVADAFLRNEAYQIPNTHCFVARDNNPSRGLDDADDVHGQRQYLVMAGGKPNAVMEPDVSEADPTPVELTYTAEKARSYHIWQPDGDTMICARSTDTADTTQTLTIEDEGANTSVELELDGDTLVADATTFSDIDAAELSAETEGDVKIFINDAGDESAPTEGTELMTIRGSAYYATDAGTLEGDLGVPTLGAGSAASPIDEPFEDFLGDRVERPAGVSVAPSLNNITLEVSNNFDPRPRQNSQRMRVHEGNREITMEADFVGEKSSHDILESALGAEGLDMEWELSRSLFTLPSATITEPPARTRESDQSFAEDSVTYESKGITITNTT